jgi:hypothetical protein
MNKIIIIGVLLFSAILILYDMKPHFVDSPLWKYIDAFATAFTLALVFIEFYDRRRENDTVPIYFKIKSLNLRVLVDKNLLRKDIRRSEVQGVLRSNLNQDRNVYTISFLSSDEYLQSIGEIQKGQLNELNIELKDTELYDFRDLIKKELANEGIDYSVIEAYLIDKKKQDSIIVQKLDKILEQIKI